MSVEASKWAWEQPGLSPAEKLVLLCLADHADENGENCFPSQRRIAQKTDLRKETVTRAVRALRVRGLIRTQPISDLEPFRNVLLYRLALVTNNHPPVTEDHHPPVTNSTPLVTYDHRGGDVGSPGVVTLNHPEPSIRTVKEPNKNAGSETNPVSDSAALRKIHPERSRRKGPPQALEWPQEHRDILEFLQTQPFLEVPMEKFGLLDYAWWELTSECCGGSFSLALLQREFPKLAAWLREKGKRLTKRGARTRIRNWLENAVEWRRRDGAAQGDRGGQRLPSEGARRIGNAQEKYAGDIERGKAWDRLHGLD